MNSKGYLIVIFSLFIGFASFPFTASAQVKIEGARHIPVQTNEGTFIGTWYYVDRDQQFALYFKEEEGKILTKIRWEKSNGESFETGWDGKCKFMFRGYEGNVNFEIKNPTDKNQLEGKWIWELNSDAGALIEQGDFKVYRSEQGSKLAWIMPNWTRIMKKGTKEKKFTMNQLNVLRKASDRIISWDEIPF